MSIGCLMIDLQGHSLTEEEQKLLQHPLVGGVILFSRNYLNPAQITHLVAEIHAVRQPPLLVAVDHEGGRVNVFAKILFIFQLPQTWENCTHKIQNKRFILQKKSVGCWQQNCERLGSILVLPPC